MFEEDKAIWLDILKYSQVNKVSISTIRRQIKLNKVEYKLEDGKYYLLSNNKNIEDVFIENEKLKQENKKIREEMEELKMLIMLYEKKVSTN